jgi:hypothetical protein
MRNIILTVWLTTVVLATIYNTEKRAIIECNGAYFVSKTINTLIWCGFIYWFGG